jgi:hypothetical protein
MLCARSLLLIGLASVAISADKGAAQSLFPFLNAAPPSPETRLLLPPAADPN